MQKSTDMGRQPRHEQCHLASFAHEMLESRGKLNHLVKIVAHLIHSDEKSCIRFRESIKKLPHANAPRGSRL